MTKGGENCQNKKDYHLKNSLHSWMITS